MFLSAAGIIAIITAMLMAAVPPQRPASQTINDLVDRGVQSVAIATDVPADNELPSFSLEDSVARLQGYTSQASAAAEDPQAHDPSKFIASDPGPGYVSPVPVDRSIPAKHMSKAEADALLASADGENKLYAIDKEYFENPTWMGTYYDIIGQRWIFVGEWTICQHIQPDLSYHALHAYPVVENWNRLGMAERQEAVNTCGTQW